jgi:hypothetical protein
MVKIEPFQVEQWMNRLEGTPGVLNIAETCAASVSIDELVGLSDDPSIGVPIDLSRKLTYGEIPGSADLRRNIARVLSRDEEGYVTENNVIVTQGAIQANFLSYYTLVGPGDHVICVYPAYQQLYAVPASLGAEVSLWKLQKEKGYIPDAQELAGLAKDNTKVKLSAEFLNMINVWLTFAIDDRHQQSKQPNRFHHSQGCAPGSRRLCKGTRHHRSL